eukprot:532711-Hanusia_phi.AAC.1
MKSYGASTDFSSASPDEWSPFWIPDSVEDPFSFLPLSHPSRLPIQQLDDFHQMLAAPLEVLPFCTHNYLLDGFSDLDHGIWTETHVSLPGINGQDSTQLVEHKSANKAIDQSSGLAYTKQPQKRPKPEIVRVQSRQSSFLTGKPVEITLERLAEHFHESLE